MLRPEILKYLLIIIGLLFVGIGVIGIIVPGLPTTIFLIIAAGCFARSSPCLHAWLMSHPWFGSTLYHWQESKSIPRKAKIIALIMMGVAAIYTCFVIESITVRIFIVSLMIIPVIFVYRLPLAENSVANQQAYEEQG